MKLSRLTSQLHVTYIRCTRSTNFSQKSRFCRRRSLEFHPYLVRCNLDSIEIEIGTHNGPDPPDERKSIWNVKCHGLVIVLLVKLAVNYQGNQMGKFLISSMNHQFNQSVFSSHVLLNFHLTVEKNRCSTHPPRLKTDECNGCPYLFCLEVKFGKGNLI